jgi:hypothetical protein
MANQRLRTALAAAGLTQPALAERVQVDPQVARSRELRIGSKVNTPLVSLVGTGRVVRHEMTDSRRESHARQKPRPVERMKPAAHLPVPNVMQGRRCD